MFFTELTGSSEPVEISGGDGKWMIRWAEASMVLTADTPIVGTQEPRLNGTLL